MVLRPAEQDGHILALDKAIIFEALPKLAQAIRDRLRRQAVEEPHHRHRLLLRPRGERPCRRRPANECDEVAPSHSMTSSARASSEVGTSRPSALAVLRLLTNSYLVGDCSGRTAGSAPRSMRST